MAEYFLYFLAWTFLLYWLHRSAHVLPSLRNFHRHHHVFVNRYNTGWHWNNLFLFNDNWASTVDLWITEVIPTFVYSWLTGQWWIMIFYYFWAAFLQEELEHRKNLNLYPLTCGMWHLKHHHRPNKNYGLFFPLWDKIFGTEMK
jgi:sterol desaturase/sphingolipid hydroxylase (fatty acid hydroxylase superfamily)